MNVSIRMLPCLHHSRISLLILAAFLGSIPWAAQGQDHSASNSSATVVATNRPVSVFVDDPQSGKDPFFPDSQRRFRLQSRATTTGSAPSTSVFSQLSLKGISRNRQHKLAMINNVTMAEGEKAEIKLLTQSAVIRCIEIRNESVLIALEGVKEVKELQLRKGI